MGICASIKAECVALSAFFAVSIAGFVVILIR